MRRLAALIALTLLAACGAGKEVVVVYSPHGADVLKDYEQLFEAAHPDVDVQWFDLASQDVYNRVSASKNRPVADVWWGGTSTIFMQAAKDDLLEPYTPSWASSVGPAYSGAHQKWYGTYRSPLAIMFNTRGLTKETAPQSWDDLLLPEWNQRITIRKPLPSGTMRTFIGATMLREGSEEAGLAWLGKLHAATKSYMDTPQLMFDHVKRNDDLVSVWLMPDVVLQRQRNGYPFDYVIPKQAPVLTEGIAIVKSAPHPEWAKKFYEFVTTPEALAHQAEAYGKVPAREDLDPATLPDWMNGLEIDALPIDWLAFAENEKRWCERWDQEVYNAQ
jgi:iron(III) transport system substrate-binding protein